MPVKPIHFPSSNIRWFDGQSLTHGDLVLAMQMDKLYDEMYSLAMTVELKPIDRNNLREVLKLKVSEEETDFVAPNSYSLAEAYVEPDLNPRAIYANSTLVGFVMYGKWFGADSYWITRLMISSIYRGRGSARKAIGLVIAELFKQSDCRKISISFVPSNKAARALYESLGFQESGVIEDEIRYDLHR